MHLTQVSPLIALTEHYTEKISDKNLLNGVNLVWFYGTSTIVGYSMPNPFLYI